MVRMNQPIEEASKHDLCESAKLSVAQPVKFDRAKELEAALQARAIATAAAWRLGHLRYLLHAGQKQVYDAVRASTSRRYVLEIARRFGKTVLLVTIALEECLRKPGSRVVYAAPTHKLLTEFVHPAFALVCRDAPPNRKPVWNAEASHYTLPNKSWVHLFGADDERQAARGRGSDAVLAIFDEAAFCSVLPTVLDDVFAPSLQLTNGRVLIGSTPAATPDHPFTQIAEREEARGNYARRTWHDNPMLSDAQRDAVVREAAEEQAMTVEEYRQTPKYRREYLAERVIDPALAAVPEWEEARATQFVAVPRPALFRGQEGGDFGGVDPHFWVFGYWSKELGLVIERELYLRGNETTLQLGDAVKDVERQLWGTSKWDGTIGALEEAQLREQYGDVIPSHLKATRMAEQPWGRYVDNDTQLARDLFAQGLAVMPTRKDNKELAVDDLRVLIRKRMLWVHPSCVNLDRHLRSTTWNNLRREQWARRSGDHGDGVDALVYLYRNVSRELPGEPGAIPVGLKLKRAALPNTALGRRLGR